MTTSPADFIQQGIEDAESLGYRSFSACTTEFPGRPSARGFTLEWGRDARVDVTTHLPWDPDRAVTMTVPIEDVWSLAVAGNTIARVTAPPGPDAAIYTAAARVHTKGSVR